MALWVASGYWHTVTVHGGLSCRSSLLNKGCNSDLCGDREGVCVGESVSGMVDGFISKF